MARPKKTGLDYFYKGVDDWDDIRRMDLMEKFGPVGFAAYDVVLCQVYKNGYYLEVSLDKLALYVMRMVGRHWFESREQARQIIEYCGEIGLFDRELLAQSVVTSKEIQRHYADVSARRKADRSQYWLLPLDDEVEKDCECTQEESIQDVSAAETRINAAKTQQSKVKQSKAKKRKANESKAKQSKAKQTGAPSGEENAAHEAAAAAAAVPTDSREKARSDRDVETRYTAVTGRTMNAADREVLSRLRREGASDALMISVLDDVARRGRGQNGKINSFRYFEQIVREAMTRQSMTGEDNASDGRYPETYSTADIEAILDAEAYAAYAACSSDDYDYD